LIESIKEQQSEIEAISTGYQKLIEKQQETIVELQQNQKAIQEEIKALKKLYTENKETPTLKRTNFYD